MANATVLPPLSFFQWSIPTAPNPRLAAPISAAETTITFTSAPLDSTGAVIATAFVFGIRRSDNYVESVLVPAGGMSVDGLTATGCTRGIKLEGTDYTAAGAGLAVAHNQNEKVFCNITGVYEAILKAAVQGTVATGGSDFIIGTDADGTVTISRSTGAGTFVGWLRWNTGVDMAQFSNDGAAWTSFSDSVASVLFKVSAADTTPGYANVKIVGGTNVTTAIGNPAGNEELELSAAGPLASIVTDVSATEAEIDQALDGISANVTAGNLNTLTAGIASDADALHTHGGLLRTVLPFTAGEVLAAGDTVYINGLEQTVVEADANAYLQESAPTTNDHGTDLYASFPNAGATRTRSILHFDISAQPASVTKAFIRLYEVTLNTTVGVARKLRLENLNGTFDENTVTWNTQPGVDGTTVDTTYNVQNAYLIGAPYFFDITTIYNTKWNVDNFGLRIWWASEAAGSGANQAIVGSRTNGTAARRPDLILLTEGDDYGKVFKCSSDPQAAGYYGIVVTGGAADSTVYVQVIGTNSGFAGLTPYTPYAANSAGTIATASVLESQMVATSDTTVKILDKRREYSSDVLDSQETIYDADKALVLAPVGLMIDNQTNTAQTASSTYNIQGWILSTPNSAGTGTQAVGMATLDILN